jgi:hypothetical protein
MLPNFGYLLQVTFVDLSRGGGIIELEAFQHLLSQYD